ncbi:ADP-ribosylglycohydrolase family protein [Nocardioides cynanchi]|uniref:ADP-ribosylglycohydrolase family protein n=1 Tax=Nocardioides cynanchi TaxID=2558918 RepID=UPI00124455CD|nr:ADP-ribosylglycohydrolase family protein [Nocardioides cynanchi]
MDLTPEQLDRAAGAMLAAAAGDALGAGYEFGTAAYHGSPEMIGGGLGGFAPGEWTDDTAQGFAILEVAATGADLRSEAALDAIAANLAEWYAGRPPDVGIQTSAVLSLAGRDATAAVMTEAAREVHERNGRSAGNGSLMRTAPVALAHLDDPEALVEAAMKVSALTHHDPVAGGACAVWCLIIRHAVLHGQWPELDGGDRLQQVRGLDSARPPEGYSSWRSVLREAEQQQPDAFGRNAWVIGAQQAAWSAITHTPVPDDDPSRHLQDALGTAIGIGHDTDTVAAIAGALLGARWGASAVPDAWRTMLHGWRDQTGDGLVELARRTVRRR